MKVFVWASLFIVAVTLPACAGLAMGEGLDLPGMSVDELYSLRERIDDELNRRDEGGGSLIVNGVYIGGETIKAGTYTFTCLDAYSSGTGVQIYENKEKYERKSMGKSTFLAEGESLVFHIADGTVLEIERGSGRIKKYEADWVP